MKQEIRFKGMSLDRDELATQHGELAFCGGVDLHNGSLRPSILDGTEEITLKIGEVVYELLYVHVGPSGVYKHYIAKRVYSNQLMLYSFKVENGSTTYELMHTFRGDDEIKDIKANGNYLAVIDNDGIQYFLWKDDGVEVGYDFLGQIPEIDIQFGLSNKIGYAFSDDIDIDLDDLHGHDHYDVNTTVPITIDEEDQAIVTEKVLAKVNKMVNLNYDNGYFSFPFFVRYALRLYDGSLTRHSSPILMMPSGGVCTYTPSTYDGNGFKFLSTDWTQVLAYYISSSTQLDNLLSWKDIVKSVDVFISAPIYTYNQGGTCKRFLPSNYYSQNESYKAKGFFRYNISSPATAFTEHDALPYTNNGVYKLFVELPQFEDDNHSTVENTSNFFLFRSISLKDLKDQEVVEFEPKTGELTSITAKPQMTDDYDSHDNLKPANSYLYNARLNIFNIAKDKFEGFHPIDCFNITSDTTKQFIMDCYVHIRSNIGTTIVHRYKQLYKFTDGCMPRWFYYPDPNAFKAVWLVRAVSGYNSQDPAYKDVDIYELDLTEHSMLNGAYWFDDFKEPTKVGTYVDDTYYPNYPAGLTNICPLDDLEDDPVLPDSCKPLANTNRTVQMPNSIYTSKANNPFFFPNLVDDAGVNTVGSGTILGMATVTRALSTGQVGDQDLIVFASDGIWVMKVSSTGAYTNINNISREVCTGQENICQLDQSVIFATNRSINRFRESDSVPISDVLDGPNVPFTTIMPDFCGIVAQDVANMITFAQTMNISMLENCKVIYDYSMLRLLVLQKNQQGGFTNIALVFCMSDESWSLMVTPIALKAFIPGYPYPFYQDTTGKVYVLDKPYHKIANTTYNGAIITRILAFSETMDVIQGYQQLCNLGAKPLIYIYGSNDQNTWKLLGYSNREFTNYLPGHPFRYFRVAMAITMTTEERYQSIVLDVVNKYAKL